MRATHLLPTLLLAASCSDRTFADPQKLGGQLVPAAVLNRGKVSYTLYCRACHGDQGDGTGPASLGYRPPPRDFTTGLFKFAAVAPGSLPRDADLLRTVKYGLHGSAMLAWEVPDADLAAILQYLKTFSPRWKDEEPGEAIPIAPDPFGPLRAAEAIERGRKVYHGLAQCLSCHPAYATRAEIAAASKELTGAATTAFRAHLHDPELKDSDYVDRHTPVDDAGTRRHLKLLAPDFLFNEVRSVRNVRDPQTAGEDLYRVIASGIGGTAMPQWQGALPDTDLWGLTYYVRSLIVLRDTPAAAFLRQRLLADDALAEPGGGQVEEHQVDHHPGD